MKIQFPKVIPKIPDIIMVLTNGQLFKSLFENLINGCAHCQCVYNDNGELISWTYVLVNKAYTTVTGIPDPTGKTIHDILPKFFETNPETVRKYERVSKGGNPERFEQYVPRLEKWLFVSVYSVETGTFTVVLDNISEHKNIVRTLQAANNKIEQAYDETLGGLVSALRIKDKGTEDHSQRVIDLTVRMAEALSIHKDEIKHWRRGALLHDIGKIVIEDALLLKPGKLTDEETETMKGHALLAYEILKPLSFISGVILDIPHYHHERWDGSGYPEGLKGDEIPFAARVFALVDVFDALTSDRPYRRAFTKRFALQYISDNAGLGLNPTPTLFDQDIAKVFIKVMG